MLEQKLKWPSYYPCNCPPDVEGRELTVYRFANKKTITEKDFKPKKVLKPEELFEDDCKACGLSVYTDKQEIQQQHKDRPHLRRKQIMEILITKGTGRVKDTPTNGNSHHTWWVDEDTNPIIIAKIMEGEE